MEQEKGRDGGSASEVWKIEASLIRDLRDVGTGKIRHVFAGACPETWKGGEGTEHDRADPQDGCKACDVLRRADELLGVSDRSDTVAIGAVAFPDDVDTETLRELDAFREKMLGLFPRNLDESAVILDTHLHKVRAHIVANERERVRLERDLESALQEIKDFDLVWDL